MTLVELLNKIPDSKWTAQMLSYCITNIKQKKRPNLHSEVSFVTEEITPTQVFNDSGKVGFVVWIDRETFNKETN